MSTLRISFFSDETSNVPKALDVTWEQLAQQLNAPKLAPCTVADGPSKCVGPKCPHKLGQAWSPGAYAPGAKRSKRTVAAVSVFAIDLDHMTDLQLAAVALKLEPYRYIAHATHSDRDGDRCLRVVLALDQPVAGADWDRFWLTAIAELDLPLQHKRDQTGGIDAPTRDPSRLFFLPSRPHDGGFLSATNEGAPINVAAIMAKAPAPAEREALNLPGTATVVSEEVMQAAALELAAAWPPKGRHYAFLALAGALAMHGWPEEAITDLTTRVARFMPNSDEKAIADRPLQAASSIAMVLAGQHVTGWGTLASEYLTRPEAVDRVRAMLGMQNSQDAISLAVAGLFESSVAETPAPTMSSEYPSLDALETYKPIQAVPEVTAEPGTFLAHVQQARRDVSVALGTQVGTPSHAPLFMSARDLFAMKYPPTPWLIQGLLTDKGTAAILAEPKSTKSWLAIEFAMSVASGTVALGKYGVPTARPTAYFFAEDQGPAVRTRLAAFASGRGMRHEDLTANLYIQPRGENLDLTKDEDVSRIVASCRAIGNIGLLVLDPLRDIHSGAENDSDDMSAVFKRIRLIGTLLDCAVLLVHHSKRSSKDKEQDENRPGSDARGSSAIEGALDAIISLRDLRGNGTDELINTVVTQIKNAKSAGTFQLTLKIRDNADNQAEHAVWSIGAEAPKVEAATFDQLVVQALEHMMGTELRKERSQTTEMIRKAVTRKYELVAAAMIQAERDGFVLKHLVGKKQVGWLMTESGRTHVRSAHQTPTPPEAPAEVGPSADPRLLSGFGISGASPA